MPDEAPHLRGRLHQASRAGVVLQDKNEKHSQVIEDRLGVQEKHHRQADDGGKQRRRRQCAAAVKFNA